jgi:hypothetical protein
MPLPFNCPHCGLETLTDDEYAGQSGPCAGCGKTITVPLPVGSLQRSASVATARGVSPRMVTLVVVLSIFAASVVFTLLITLVFPMFHVARDLLHKSQCRSHLIRIAQALKQYEAEHGTLPPAFIADANGKPMHSWRVLILPQLGEHGIYDRYHFNEPWDGPNNSMLVSQMPEVFACPADPDARMKGETSYMVITGPQTLFPGASSMRSADINDELATTILVTETPVAGVVWMEPKDLNASRMQFSINSGSTGEIGSYHAQGAHAVMANESVRFIDQLFPSDYLQSMSTPQGGEDIPWEVLD